VHAPVSDAARAQIHQLEAARWWGLGGGGVFADELSVQHSSRAAARTTTTKAAETISIFAGAHESDSAASLGRL
jgi:hypothetical protein